MRYSHSSVEQRLTGTLFSFLFVFFWICCGFFNTVNSATSSVLQHRQKTLLSEPATGLNHPTLFYFLSLSAMLLTSTPLSS